MATTAITSFLQSLRLTSTSSNSLQHHQEPQTQQKVYPTALSANTDGNLPSGLPEISLNEVALHDDYKDCWIVIYDRVYDVTDFLSEHPGGADIILDHAGRDATLSFHGTGHSQDAIDQMRDFLIGELPSKERIFRTSSGSSKVFSTSIIPE